MESVLIAPSNFTFLGIPTILFSLVIPVVGVGLFAYIMAKRLAPLVKAAPDDRFNDIPVRIFNVAKIWLAQWRQPRYMTAG
ncbi:MAG: electron transfer flavoprotein, partial [Deltaproteobacteria bacterium]